MRPAALRLDRSSGSGGIMTPARELPRAWRARAEQLRPYSPAASRAFDEAAGELESALGGEQGALLDLQEAARESGYSADYLGRLVREGQIRNAGRRNAPRIRRGDLPRKAAALPRNTDTLHVVGATPGQIARAVVTPDGRGSR